MNDLILHHYPASPYAEKARRMLASKKLDWHSVLIPAVMPKPDLMPLTGGYRKTPVLQIGCDIYCDTKLIARVLDQLAPEPPLVPPGLEATALMTDRWVEQILFFHVVTLFFQPASLAGFAARADELGFTIDQFIQDRMAMFALGGSAVRPSLETVRAELPGVLQALDAQLSVQPFLHGAAPTQMDFSVFHPVWFGMNNPALAGEFEPYAHVRGWYRRIAAMPSGVVTAMSGADAIQRCRSSSPRAPLAGASLTLPSIAPGAAVKVSAQDYGVDAVQGELVISSTAEIAIRRDDPRAGRVIVHFPPEGFSVSRAG